PTASWRAPLWGSRPRPPQSVTRLPPCVAGAQPPSPPAPPRGDRAMPPSTWNPPSGSGARRAVDEALAAARERDRQLRAEIARMVADRIVAAEELETSRTEAEDACTLAARALTRSDQSAQAGQRAEAATVTGAARVFAMRWRDARARAADAEAWVAAADEGRRRAEAGLAANAGALDKAAAVYLASVTGRRAAKMQAEVDATVSEISTPA